MIKTSKGSTPSDNSLSRVPSSAKSTPSSRRGASPLVAPGACLWGNPGSRCGCQHGDSDCNTQAPDTSVGATLFLPGSSRKEKAVAHSLHSHSRSQAQKTLVRPGPATLLHLSMRSPPETNPIQDELLIAALENQLSNLKQHLQLERLA